MKLADKFKIVDQPADTTPSNILSNNMSTRVEALLDTGALQGSYMSTRVAQRLEEETGLKFDRCMTRVCTAFNNCKISDKMSTLAITFVNNKTKFVIDSSNSHY